MYSWSRRESRVDRASVNGAGADRLQCHQEPAWGTPLLPVPRAAHAHPRDTATSSRRSTCWRARADVCLVCLFRSDPQTDSAEVRKIVEGRIPGRTHLLRVGVRGEDRSGCVSRGMPRRGVAFSPGALGDSLGDHRSGGPPQTCRHHRAGRHRRFCPGIWIGRRLGAQQGPGGGDAPAAGRSNSFMPTSAVPPNGCTPHIRPGTRWHGRGYRSPLTPSSAPHRSIPRPSPEVTRFIVISGIDGCGKTTLIRALRNRLEQEGLTTRYEWLRYNHRLVRPVHGLSRLVGLSRRYRTADQSVWRHEFYRSRLFCSFYILLTWLDAWLGRLMLAARLQFPEASMLWCATAGSRTSWSIWRWTRGGAAFSPGPGIRDSRALCRPAPDST